MIAKFIKEVPGGNKGAALYYVDPPVTYSGRETSYVICSSSEFTFSPFHTIECYAFPSNEIGEFLEMCGLPGSQKGTLSHKKILNNMGYYLWETSYVEFFEAL